MTVLGVNVSYEIAQAQLVQTGESL